MDSLFERRNEPYNLRNFQEFLTEKKRTALWSWDTWDSYWSPQLWSLLPENIKEVASLEIFQREKTGSVTIVHADYVNLICRILDFFKVIYIYIYIYIATIYNVLLFIMYYVLFSIIVNVLVGRCKLVLNRRYKSTVKKVFFKQKTKKRAI